MDYPQQHIKPYDEEGKKTEQVERMFDNIAHAYDKLNHTLSLGIDRSWRKKAIAWLRPFQPQRMIDVATGTGDFAILACRKLQKSSFHYWANCSPKITVPTAICRIPSKYFLKGK